jgi:CheY-specific phosphatase CheX
MSGNPIKKIPEKKIDQVITEAVFEASLKVLKVAAGIEAAYDHEYTCDTSPITSAFIGTVELSGIWNGTLSLWIPFNLARHLTAKIVGCDPGTLNEAYIRDGASEIINQISGRMMTTLSQKGHKIRPGLPDIKMINHLEPKTHDSISTLTLKCTDSRIILQLSPETPPPE